MTIKVIALQPGIYRGRRRKGDEFSVDCEEHVSPWMQRLSPPAPKVEAKPEKATRSRKAADPDPATQPPAGDEGGEGNSGEELG